MKAGIVTKSLGLSQKAFEIIREINQVGSLEEYWDIVVFYVEYDRLIIPPKFALMNVLETYGMNCPLISTCIETTEIALNSIKATKRFFYIYDMEWTTGTNDVDRLLNVYCNPKVELIARSKDHANVIKNCWKEPIAIIENFNYEQITKLISQ